MISPTQSHDVLLLLLHQRQDVAWDIECFVLVHIDDYRLEVNHLCVSHLSFLHVHLCYI